MNLAGGRSVSVPHADQALTRTNTMRRWVSRMATGQMFWSDQGTGELGSLFAFWGRAVRLLAHPRQYREGQHHQADVPVPAVQRTNLVVVQTQFGLAIPEFLINVTALSLDMSQVLD